MGANHLVGAIAKDNLSGAIERADHAVLVDGHDAIGGRLQYGPQKTLPLHQPFGAFGHIPFQAGALVEQFVVLEPQSIEFSIEIEKMAARGVPLFDTQENGTMGVVTARYQRSAPTTGFNDSTTRHLPLDLPGKRLPTPGATRQIALEFIFRIEDKIVQGLADQGAGPACQRLTSGGIGRQHDTRLRDHQQPVRQGMREIEKRLGRHGPRPLSKQSRRGQTDRVPPPSGGISKSVTESGKYLCPSMLRSMGTRLYRA